ncbi:MAG: GTP pyrophosphokinase family protein [Oscillospiraceae bacterium]|jgi:putative GTP pyrophosphokinase|nr:GTP pyrophosphokinase family protein [Oscillospiraceae bacterium]
MTNTNGFIRQGLDPSLEEIIFTEDWQHVVYDISALSTLYNAGMKEVITKLEILDTEFSSLYNHNPIHHIEHRLKSPLSIIEKMQKKGIESTQDMIDAITDIAGVRVVCNYIEDVYSLAETLAGQNDITLMEQRDYIKTPKDNGYRSLHLIVKVPVFLSSSTEHIFVEIQLRTIAMDMWASLEHEIRYKRHRKISDRSIAELKICSEMLHSVDNTMQNIYKHTDDTYDAFCL